MMLEPVEPYRAYIDDSSSAEDDRILLLAGYARAPAWAAFSDEWKIELAKPPAIEYCHMSEAESLKDQFLGWSATKRDRKIASLANVIVKYEPWSIECYVRKSQYDQILAPVIAYDLRGPYFPCFYGVIVTLARFHAQTGIKLPTDFIFDEQGKIGAEAVLWYEAIKRAQKPEIQALMGSTPDFKDDKKVLPLQAADMIAWHLRRRKEKRNAHEYREVMEILSPLLRIEVELSETVLRTLANEMASLPNIASVQGKRGSIKKYMVGGKLLPMVTLICKKCGEEFDCVREFFEANPRRISCAFCGEVNSYASYRRAIITVLMICIAASILILWWAWK